MKQVKIVIAATLFCVFAVASSASAFSENEWLLNGSSITSAVAVKSKFTLALIDMAGKLKITCEGTDEGTVGPGVVDSVTKVTATKCTQQEGVCETSKPITIKMLHLPWSTKLVTTEGEEARDLIENSGSGEPGWVIECTVIGIFKTVDECTGMTNTGIKNVTGGVESVFESIGNEEALNCSLGGGKAGLIEGTDLYENPAGGTLTVKGPDIDVEPVPLNFGKIKAGEEPEKPIEFENLGPGAWNPGVAKVFVGPLTFEVVAAKNTCNKPIAVKGRCKVEIKFKPKAAGMYVGTMGFGIRTVDAMTGEL